MIYIVKREIFRKTGLLHSKIFDHDMSGKMTSFITHLSWSMFGSLIAAAIMSILNIIAGRLLGPTEYGRCGLIVATASIFIIPMTLGIDTASIYYISKDSKDNKKLIISSSLTIGLILIVSFSTLSYLITPVLSKLLRVEESIIRIVIIFSIFLSLRNILDAFLKGFHLFKFQTAIRILESTLTLIAFFILMNYLDIKNYKSYIISILIGYTLVIILNYYKVRPSISFNLEKYKEILHFGSYAIFGSISGMLFNSMDKILVNKYLGEEQLGIYNAYTTVSLLLIGQLTAAFINVFFPHLTSIDDKAYILSKINRLAKLFFGPSFILLSGVIWIAMTLFGQAYPIDLLLIVECSLLGILTGYFAVLWWLINSEGVEGIRFTIRYGILMGVSFVVLIFIFRDVINIYIVILFLILSILLSSIIGNLRFAKRGYTI